MESSLVNIELFIERFSHSLKDLKRLVSLYSCPAKILQSKFTTKKKGVLIGVK